MKQPDLGKKILELRLANGLTQGQLAEKCNLSLRTIQRIESAKVTPRSYTIKLIFSNLDYDIYNSFGKLSYKIDRLVYKLRIWFEVFFKYVIGWFNLKTNTMKKLSLVSLIVIFISSGFFLIINDAKGQSIEGWFKAGNKPDSYKVGLDNTIFKTGGSSAFIKSIEKKIDGFGTLMQKCKAQEYLGKRIKMTGFIRSNNVSDWAGMWMRIDSKLPKRSLIIDNMEDRPIRGDNDWIKCEIILDVPKESGNILFGVLLMGTGKVWFDNISFEIVDKLTTKPTKEILILEKPTNIDFEEKQQ